MGQIVNGAHRNIDAIISGHTHLAYNHAIPVQAWIDEGRAVTTRPVVSAGQYGYNLNQLVFTVDPRRRGRRRRAERSCRWSPRTRRSAGHATRRTTRRCPRSRRSSRPPSTPPRSWVRSVLGTIEAPFNRAKLANGTTENRGGESTLGNLVAEVQRWATSAPESGSAQIAFMNPGGLRAGHGRHR